MFLVDAEMEVYVVLAAWASLAKPFPASSFRAGEGTDCGGGGDVTGGRLTGLSSALPFPLHL